ncbi:DUF2207 domain-containing protein [Bacillus sp. REN16]|uniref:DUF2207 domain-containing protein n=1 Tax=Bacillus sp. REN16 TaxID=2887296 RepID=UPI001E57191E|nr:DUF2207 domain-containing protein [Bacillus sp. REN16]MCC3358546.1 DUF2207 domain-containing protein [Bacillus sp. REN16]
MRVKLSGLIFVIVFLFIFPMQGFAVDYWINDVKMDAYLQDDGIVKVTETHTYEFDGEFNGITRTVIPKKGSSIKDFSATENGKELRVEKEEDFYKIHRKGKDETITVTLAYTIQNGVEIFEDVAQFYWPFFDNRNESTYENLVITVHPPQPTSDVVAFGYDEAFQKETVQSDGSVIFHIGEVPNETNGDIRVAYDVGLFSGANYVTADKPMKEEILSDKNELLIKAQERAETKKVLSKVAMILVPIFSLIVLIMIVRNRMEGRAKLNAVKQEMINPGALPKQVLSLPATIFYTNSNFIQQGPGMAAALLDLVRMKMVKHVAEERFELVNQDLALPHEKILIEWLFEKIGHNGEFSLSDLKTYSIKKNSDKYTGFQMKWGEAVRNEVKEQQFYEDKTKFKLILGFLGIVLVPFLFLFPMYELFAWFVLTLILFGGIIVYLIAYRPKNSEGLRIFHEWLMFKESYKALSPDEWKKWSEDDQMRAYIYGLGSGDKGMMKQNEDLVFAFNKPYYYESAGFYPYSVYSFGYVGPNASAQFESANESIGTGSSTSSSSSGGGTGGGGGGSGAF